MYKQYHPIILIFLLVFLAQNAFAQETFLRRNLPMHSADIKRISIDAQGRYLLSASLDKTAKLWDAHTGTLLQTYRVPISQGNDGQLYAAALAPDARVVALGGWTGYDVENSHSIYLLNRQTGQILHRITGLPNVIYDLEFSPDGRYLVAALGGKNGLRVYNTQNWQVQASLTGYGDNSYNIAFAPTGQLASVCYDGYVRLYNAQFQLQQEQKLGNQPYSLAFSPDGTKLAIGFADSPNIQVLDARSLALLYQPDITGATTVGNHVGAAITFSPDGNELWAGGFYSQYHEGHWWNQIRRWARAGRGSYQDFGATDNSISDLKTLPNGELWVAGFAPDLARFAPDGNKLFYQKHDNLNFGAKDRTHLQLKATGQEVGFTPYEQTALSFSVAERRLSKQSLGGQSFVENKAGIGLSNWNDSYSPLLNGQKLNFLEQYETSWCVDIAQTSFVLGADWYLYAADAQGKMLWKTPTQAVVWAVNITDNQQAVVAAMGDGTIRWYRLSDGQLLLTLYVHATTQQWVLWTPSGYYDASAGAEDFLGWHLNQGQSPMFYPISKFRNTFYRPDVIDRILDTYDEAQAVEQANSLNNRKKVSTDVVQMLPPTVTIVSHANNQAVSNTNLTLKYTLNSPNAEPIIGVQAYVDGRPVAVERGMKPTFSINITIPPRDSKVSIIAENRFGYSEPSIITLRWNGKTESAVPKPKLYILSIGVSDYVKKEYKLDYPAKDATDFVNALKEQQEKLYDVVEVKLLTNQVATKDNILEGLEWLQKQTTSKDIAMLFLAGHGTNDNTNNFYFMPHNAEEQSLKRTCVSGADIGSTVQAIAGKILVFTDACHSGNVFGLKRSPNVDILINELSSAENGAIVFTSSTAKQSSLESSTWNNGAFTKALVEGIRGSADKSQRGYISVKSLDAYIAERVKELTKGQQAPVTLYPKGGTSDFPIAVGR
ncbi:caspase family protein [Flectobacillus roseus]